MKLCVREHGAGTDKRAWLWLHKEALIIYFVDNRLRLHYR